MHWRPPFHVNTRTSNSSCCGTLRFKGVTVTLALFILVAAVAFGMSARQGPTISSSVNVVALFATVHDADGKAVKDLTPDDFVLLEDGVPQEITYFSLESDLPLTIGLLVDTSRSQTRVLEQERRASYTFLDQVLREGKDQAFVVHFDIEVGTLQGPTSSRDALELALARLKIPERDSQLLRILTQRQRAARPPRGYWFLITSPPFMTKCTLSSTCTSASGSPCTATMSANFPGSSVPTRSDHPIKSAAFNVAA
jgi:hypothetical protein